MNRTYKIFVDFDGTITTTDVGENLFLEFGDEEESKRIVDLWMNDEISSIECWQYLVDTVPFVTEEQIDRFLESIEIDNYFLDFNELAKLSNINIFVVSDGFDYYIDKILKRYNLSHLKVFSNKLKISCSGRLIPSFPTTDENCSKCANCKRNHIINNSSDDDYTIYVGDGYSDACPVQYCDYVFAKKSLLKYCEKNRISYFPFNNFNDVNKKVKLLLAKNTLKKRKQAELRRKKVYKQG